ncbi:MAG: trypsin-like peptidase domain-containing protein [Methylibium sp.]|nr:trypsin-like peptidase domain-containing protein [Methylibium sp.]
MIRIPAWRGCVIGWLIAVTGTAACAQTAVPKTTPSASPSPAPASETTPPAPLDATAALPLAPVSPSAQRLYELARGQLVQVRTLLKGQDSQASVGSGFFVSDDGLILTNYHVVSQLALQPERYRLVYTRVDGREGSLQLLGFDAVHDLALVKALPAGAGKESAPRDLPGAPLAFRPADEPLAQGERIYSLGNPLDVGFAVLEGTYNGLVERSFYPSIFFGGALNSGMSGGPALDEQGRVVGINVATRRDGQQVSFLVPARFAQALLERARTAEPITAPVYPELTAQLFAHQETVTQRFVSQPWRSAGHPDYRIPVPQEDFMRCWGRSTPSDTKGLEFERSDCEMDTRVFVSGALATGTLGVRHEAYDGSKLGVLRFTQRYSASFRNENFGRRVGKEYTAPKCHESFVEQAGLPLRAVLCMSAYKRLAGLYDLSVLVATLDQGSAGVQGRIDARGVSFDNAMRLAEHYLSGYARKEAP